MKNLKKQDFYFIFSDLDCFYLPLNAYLATPAANSCGPCLHVGAKWEHGVVMANRQAKPLWQDAVPLITGCRQARRPASPPGSTRPLFFYLRCKAEMPWGHSPENRCPSRVLRLPVIWVWFRVGGCVRRGWIPYGRVRFP